MHDGSFIQQSLLHQVTWYLHRKDWNQSSSIRNIQFVCNVHVRETAKYQKIMSECNAEGYRTVVFNDHTKNKSQRKICMYNPKETIKTALGYAETRFLGKRRSEHHSYAGYCREEDCGNGAHAVLEGRSPTGAVNVRGCSRPGRAARRRRSGGG